MKVNYINFSKKQLAQHKLFLDLVFQNTLDELSLNKDLELNLMLASKRQIKKTNKVHRNKNKVTDVLSFPSLQLGSEQIDELSELLTAQNYPQDINPETNNLFLGDIMMCYSIIKKQAKEYENTIERELGYMFVHGILHLLGFDHDTPENKKRMREVEETVLAKFSLSKSE